MTSRHRSGPLRRRPLRVVLAAVLGRGHLGRHRLAALGRPLSAVPSLPLAAAADPASRQSIAPRLSVVRPRSSHDLAVDDVLTNAILADVRQPLTDTPPHPVVALLALRSTDDAVYAEVDAEREVAATTVLAAGGPSDRARHTA